VSLTQLLLLLAKPPGTVLPEPQKHLFVPMLIVGIGTAA